MFVALIQAYFKLFCLWYVVGVDILGSNKVNVSWNLGVTRSVSKNSFVLIEVFQIFLNTCVLWLNNLQTEE